MGGGRETPRDRSEEDGGEPVYIVWPSEIHKLAYCPRLLFFELHIPRRRGLLERLRLLLGRAYHALLSLSLRLRGYRVEERLETRLGRIRLRGRSDAIRVEGGRAVVVERKSGRAPRQEAWPSDVLQAATYAFIALREGLAREAVVEIRYRNGSFTYHVDSGLASSVLQAVDDVVMIKYWGIVGYPRKSRGRCQRCPFREVCLLLDEALAPPEGEEVFEPGGWLERERLSPPAGHGEQGALRDE